MVYGLPALGETGWKTKLDASIEAVKATADAALPASTAAATYAQSSTLPVQPLAAAADSVRPLAYDKRGVVIEPGAPGAWDAAMVESACPVWVPEAQKYALIYTGYSGTKAAPDNPKLGLAWSLSPEGPYVKDAANPILGGSGVAGDPDKHGVTGAMAFKKDDGTWTIYSIGTTAAGYEGGTPSLCRYTTPSLVSPSFTRHGVAVAPGGTSWRQSKVWIGSIVENPDDGLWHLFLNGTATDGKERIGHGTATSIDGPWTMDTNPVLDVGAAGSWDSSFVGQPWVFRVGETWYMEYYGHISGGGASDGLAYTTAAAFPNGWTKHPSNPLLSPSETYDAKYAHKPFSLVLPDRILHFYTAVAADDTRQVALAVAGRSVPGLAIQDENSNVATNVSVIDFQGGGVSVAAGSAGEAVVTIGAGGGGTGQGFVDFARAKRTAGDITLNSTAWTDINTGLDLTINATAGDVVELTLAARLESATETWCVLDFHTIVSAAPVNSVTLDGAVGTAPSHPGWATGKARSTANGWTFLTASKMYTVQAGDISAGTVTFRLRGRSGGSVIVAASDPHLYVQVKNLGPQL